MARDRALESGAGNWELEAGGGNWELEAATLTTVSRTFTYLYDIRTNVSRTLTYLYDITGAVLRTFTYIYDINDNGSTSLENQNGTVTAAMLSSLNNEICFIEKTDGPRHYSLYVYLDNMASGDTIKIKTQVQKPDGTWKNYDKEKTIKFNEIKEDVAAFHVFIPHRGVRWCIKQTAGTVRSFDWDLFKSK